MPDKELVLLFFDSLRKYLTEQNSITISIKINKVYKLEELNRDDDFYPIYLMDKFELSEQIDDLDIKINEINIILKYINHINIDLIDDIILENIYKKILINYKDYKFPKEIQSTFLYGKAVADLTL